MIAITKKQKEAKQKAAEEARLIEKAQEEFISEFGLRDFNSAFVSHVFGKHFLDGADAMLTNQMIYGFGSNNQINFSVVKNYWAEKQKNSDSSPFVLIENNEDYTKMHPFLFDYRINKFEIDVEKYGVGYRPTGLFKAQVKLKNESSEKVIYFDMMGNEADSKEELRTMSDCYLDYSRKGDLTKLPMEYFAIKNFKNAVVRQEEAKLNNRLYAANSMAEVEKIKQEKNEVFSYLEQQITAASNLESSRLAEAKRQKPFNLKKEMTERAASETANQNPGQMGNE